MFEQEKCDERRRGWQRVEHFQHGEERHRGRHGGFGGPMGHDRGFGGGGGRERHFDNGELRFVILQLIADKPSYGYEIINAKSGAGQHPDLEVQTRVFRDGEQVLAGKPTPVTGAGAPDPQRLTAGGRLSLGRDMTPGQYVLQVIVTAKAAKSKFNMVTQSTEFEIEP